MHLSFIDQQHSALWNDLHRSDLMEKTVDSHSLENIYIKT